MGLTKMKKTKLLALVMVFAMLFSCGIALGDNDASTPGEGTVVVAPQGTLTEPELPAGNQTDSEITENPTIKPDQVPEKNVVEETEKPTGEPEANLEIPVLRNLVLLSNPQDSSVKIVSVANIDDITVDLGENQLKLPNKVTVTLNDNKKPINDLNVEWDNGTPKYNGNAVGEYIFTGTLKLTGKITNPQNLTAKVKVIVTAPDLVTVNLHQSHVGASSQTFERDNDDGGLTDPVVWHFVLNGVNNDLPLTINVTFATAGTKSITASKVNNHTQHFFVGTSAHDILKGAYVEGVIVFNNPMLNLSHVRVADPGKGSVQVIKTIGSIDGDPQGGITFTLTRLPDENIPQIASLESEIENRETTNENGIAIFSSLEPGQYRLDENTPDGYNTSLNAENNVIKVTAGQTSAVNVVNTPIPGSVKVTKTVSTGGPQKGVKFYLSKVIEEAKARLVSLIEPVLTDDNGIALFENLEPGQYRLDEEVPEGYNTSLNDDNRFIEVSAGETTKVDVVNTPTGGGGNPGGGDNPGGDPGDNPGGGGGTPGGGSSDGGYTTVTTQPEPAAVLPEKNLQVLPQPTAVEPEKEVKVQPEATAAAPELPRTGGNALALILGSLAAGSGLFMMTRSRKEEK